MDAITAVRNAKSVEELLPIAERAHAGLHWWSGKCVTVEGYEGVLGINSLAYHLLDLSGNPQTWHPEISRHITRIYKEGDQAYGMSSVLTKIVLFIHQLFLEICCCHYLDRGDTVDVRSWWEGKFQMGGNSIY
jgi:hypothetical protein